MYDKYCSAICALFWLFVAGTSGQTCPTPSFSGTTYAVLDMTPQGIVVRLTVSPTASTTNGWSVAVIFTSPLQNDVTVKSYATSLSGIGSDRKVITFTNKGYNQDLSDLQQFQFTFLMESSTTNLVQDQSDYMAMVAFFDFPVSDASCIIEPNEVEPLPTTMTSPTTTTIASTTLPITTTTTTTTTSTTTTTTASTTTPCQDSGLPAGVTAVAYSLDNPGWDAADGWTFIFKYESQSGTHNDWTMKIIFSAEVISMTPYEADADGPHSDGLVWLLTPQYWNINHNGVLVGTAMTVTSGNSAPSATITMYNNGAQPDFSTTNGGGSCATTSTTIASSTVTVHSTESPTIDPNGQTGYLPAVAQQTVPNFTPSADVDGENPYDYNEILHKSMLFYEAQRSGDLPVTNRIPWRGDSGLKDGCVASTCYADLVGGWYDAGDYVKFGFPMAWATTVLAWGMIEFPEAYQDAGEWDNALDCIKWTTDYFVKAHVSPNELYFQVGDPDADHAQWGHPETMTIPRPIYKIDVNNPGSEVAAETAAALAAASIAFGNTDATYATNLLNHAIQLFNFADNYRGNYHESVPESKVGNFYKSWSGYNDELMWAAMWLYKATNNNEYLNKALQFVNSVGTSEFSWDLKGPGALALLSQERSMYKTNLFAAIDNVRNKGTTPGGLTYFSQWGTNRYSANYALIALVAAKMEGLASTTGKTYHDYAKEQISFMLGSGDGIRSYVVGFGNNPPQRPHHRSSSCRLWNSDPASQVCDSTDRDAAGPNPLILYGALVGGPGSDGSYNDDRGDYIKNEVAVDYNAGFQSAVAGLKYFQITG